MELGDLGAPIDDVLVAGDAALTSLSTMPDHFGSNHRGLIAELFTVFLYSLFSYRASLKGVDDQELAGTLRLRQARNAWPSCKNHRPRQNAKYSSVLNCRASLTIYSGVRGRGFSSYALICNKAAKRTWGSSMHTRMISSGCATLIGGARFAYFGHDVTGVALSVQKIEAAGDQPTNMPICRTHRLTNPDKIELELMNVQNRPKI